MFKAILAFIVKQFWPWFKNYVWPIIKEHVVELLVFIIGMFKDNIKDWYTRRSVRRQEEAEAKAKEAEGNANNASSDNEAEKLRAIAKVWREVAEQFRTDNEDLKAKLDSLESETKATATNAVDSMELDVDFSKKTPVLALGEKRRELPKLT